MGEERICCQVLIRLFVVRALYIKSLRPLSVIRTRENLRFSYCLCFDDWLEIAKSNVNLLLESVFFFFFFVR